MTRKEILKKAEECVCGQREQDYGSPEDNFSIIAGLWSDYTGTTISPVDVSMMLALMKIARVKSGGGTGDSFVDLAGYAACGGEIHGKENKDDDIQTICEIASTMKVIKCPACNSTRTLNTKTLTSYPPQLEYTCTDCGHKWIEGLTR